MVAAVVGTLLAPALPVAADPVAPEEDPAGHEEVELAVHRDAAEHEEHGDPFGETLFSRQDPFVLPQQPTGPLAMRTEPHAWTGTPPDQDQIPAKWLEPTPAEQISPSSTEELMSADSGYYAALAEDGGHAPLASLADEPARTAAPSGDGAEQTAGPAEDEATRTSAPQEDGTEPSVVPTQEPTAASAQQSLEVDGTAIPAPPSKPLPKTLDATAGWQYTYSCDPNDKPGMVAFARLISQHYGYPTYYTSRKCLAGGNSQHYEGRAVDWPMNAFDSKQKEIGDSVAQWLTANDGEMARRFGVMSVIWNKKSWYVSVPDRWYDYTGPSPHTDHLHISFTWDGAMKRTSWWTGRAVSTIDHGTCRVYSGQYAPRYTGRNTTRCATSLPKPPESPYRVTLPWARTDEVKVAQQYLGFTGAAVDGAFGPKTLDALLDYQQTRKLYVSGVLDNQTWAHMVGTTAETIDQVSRHNGTNRYQVAASLSSATYPGGGTPLVYVASGQVFPAALAGGAAAGAVGAPLLLVKDDSIPSVIREELERLRPERIVVLGGSKTIGSGVVRELRGIATSSSSDAVERVTGDDRYQVASELAGRTYPRGASTVYLANGQGFADALTGAAVGGLTSSPLLLLRETGVPGPTAQRLDALDPDRIVVLGGPGTIPDTVVTSLTRFAPTVERIGGVNRYAVSVKATKRHYGADVDTVYVVSGQHFPAALTGGAAGARSSSPVMPTKAGYLPDRTRQEILRLKPSRVVILGGTSSVSRTVASQLRSLAW